MPTESKNCLINESACGRVAGNPVCPKCGMDERVVYPSQSDLDSALLTARVKFSRSQGGVSTAGEERPPACEHTPNEGEPRLDLSNLYVFYGIVFLGLSHGYFKEGAFSDQHYLIGAICAVIGVWGMIRYTWIAMLPFAVFCTHLLATALPFFYNFWVAALSKETTGSVADAVFGMFFIVFFAALHVALLSWFTWGLIRMAMAMAAIRRYKIVARTS